MIIIEKGQPLWAGRSLVCSFCRSILKLDSSDRPEYVQLEYTMRAANNTRKAFYELVWQCPECNQPIMDHMTV